MPSPSRLKSVNHIEQPEASAVAQLVMHEVHRPDLVQGLWNCQRFWLLANHALLRPNAQIQFELAVDAVHALVIPSKSFDIAQVQEAQAKAPVAIVLGQAVLTRSKSKLVLFVEGDDPTALYELSKPSNSGTARRNTHLFAPGVRRDQDTFAYAEHLVHRTVQGIMVQSKSELAISNYCATHGLEEFSYNRPLQGTKTVGKLRPDFTFTSDSGEVVLWEHLGMLDRADYAKSWEWKKEWYRLNEFVEGKNLFTTSEGPGLDMDVVATTAKAVKSAIANI